MFFSKSTRIPLTASAFATALAMSSPIAAATDQEGNSDSAADVRAEIADSVDAIGDYAAEQRDVAVAAAEKTLSDIDVALDRYENTVRKNWNDMSEEARNEARAAMEDLRQKRNDLAERIEALKVGANNTWDGLVHGVSDAWSDLEAAWEDTDEATNASM
ncbi:MAG: hypothetical protein RIM72_14900 [Alphaproteobacteria bacterium]